MNLDIRLDRCLEIFREENFQQYFAKVEATFLASAIITSWNSVIMQMLAVDIIYDEKPSDEGGWSKP